MQMIPSPDGMRIKPLLPASALKTYRLTQQHRTATCDEAGCAAWRKGWEITVDPGTDLGAGQAYYLRHDRTRRPVEETLPDGRVRFAYGPGQRCPVEHTIPVGRDPLLLVQGGDWRGNPRGIETYRHVRTEDWVEDFAEHQGRLSDRFQQG